MVVDTTTRKMVLKSVRDRAMGEIIVHTAFIALAITVDHLFGLLGVAYSLGVALRHYVEARE